MLSALLITVRFHDGRYHGAGSWPPSPARVFQALVAGASKGAAVPLAERSALQWLEGLPPPEIVAPPVRKGQEIKNFVPNNDLDAVGGDPARVGEIRTSKPVRPHLFDPGAPLLYLWRFDDGEAHARTITDLANRLYQLGRGVDMAWATAELLEADVAAARLETHGGARLRPGGGDSRLLPCPTPGSLASLERRFKAMGERLRMHKAGRTVSQLFTQPPKPHFRQVAYDSAPRRLLFELRNASDGEFHAWPFNQVVRLVEMVRDGAAKTLAEQTPDKKALIERVFIGRDAGEADKARRIRILPLASIGHAQVERTVRRLMVEVPPDCPLDVRDIDWAFAKSLPHDSHTGEIAWQLVAIGDDAGERYAKMPAHYGIGAPEPFRLWRTVTPAALPEWAARRRIDPRRIGEEAKGAPERLAEEAQADSAVRQALRHAGIETPVESIYVQREPFHAKGARAEAFAPGTRFSKHRLWHVQIAFVIPRAGPVVIGDGRYLGLGIMAPEIQAFRRVAVFPITGAPPPIHAYTEILSALRRALMSLDRDLDANGSVSTLFSGHKSDGSPAGNGTHEHVFLAADTNENGKALARLCIIRPDAVDRRVKLSIREKARFERVISALREVRAGRSGIITLGHPTPLTAVAPLFGPALTWASRTAYHPTRHARRGRDPAMLVAEDVVRECRRRGLPRPKVDVLRVSVGPNGGNLAAYVRLRFAAAVEGPITLGHDSHMGGGLFAAMDERGYAGL